MAKYYLPMFQEKEKEEEKRESISFYQVVKKSFKIFPDHEHDIVNEINVLYMLCCVGFLDHWLVVFNSKLFTFYIHWHFVSMLDVWSLILSLTYFLNINLAIIKKCWILQYFMWLLRENNFFLNNSKTASFDEKILNCETTKNK